MLIVIGSLATLAPWYGAWQRFGMDQSHEGEVMRSNLGLMLLMYLVSEMFGIFGALCVDSDGAHLHFCGAGKEPGNHTQKSKFDELSPHNQLKDECLIACKL